MPPTAKTSDQIAFEKAISSIESQIANVGSHLAIDSSARVAYASEIKKMADKLRTDAMSKRISWANAAQQAQETRNLVMETIRCRSTPVGRAMAQRLKAEGKTLNELIGLHTVRAHGNNAVFARLPVTQQNAIYASIVTSAGKSNVAVTKAMSRLSYAGRGVLGLSLALSAYTIATADDKVTATQKEGAALGASVAGGIAGGALAGLACGPGAPVCVTVGAFVGGALAAFGVSSFW